VLLERLLTAKCSIAVVTVKSVSRGVEMLRQGLLTAKCSVTAVTVHCDLR
jgi:hypothetical protein